MEIYTDPVLSIEIAEKLLGLSRKKATSFLEARKFKPRTFKHMNQQDSTLTKERVYSPEGKQKKFYLQNDIPFAFGPNTICIEVDKNGAIQSIAWTELKKFVKDYSFELRHSSYVQVPFEIVGRFHYKSEQKKRELLIEVDRNNELSFTFWKSE
jgi:hypothetical protein